MRIQSGYSEDTAGVQQGYSQDTISLITGSYMCFPFSIALFTLLDTPC